MSWVLDIAGNLVRTDEGEALAEVVCRSAQEDLGFVSFTFVEKQKTLDFDHAFEVKRDLVHFGLISKEQAYV